MTSSSMQSSLKYNRSLMKKRGYFKDKVFQPKWDSSTSINKVTPSANDIRRNRANNELYLENEKQKSNAGMAKAAFLTALIFTLLYWYFAK